MPHYEHRSRCALNILVSTTNVIICEVKIVVIGRFRGSLLFFLLLFGFGFRCKCLLSFNFLDARFELLLLWLSVGLVYVVAFAFGSVFESLFKSTGASATMACLCF